MVASNKEPAAISWYQAAQRLQSSYYTEGIESACVLSVHQKLLWGNEIAQLGGLNFVINIILSELPVECD
jgi:hypothetical protein